MSTNEKADLEQALIQIIAELEQPTEGTTSARYKEVFDRGQCIRTELLFLGGSEIAARYDATVLELRCSRQDTIQHLAPTVLKPIIQPQISPLSRSEETSSADNQLKGAQVGFSLPASFIADQIKSTHNQQSDIVRDRKINVFLQYARIDKEYDATVLALATRLCGDGIKAILDVMETDFPQGIPQWIREQIDNSDYILIICSAANERRFKKEEISGKGLGATYEGHLIQQKLYNTGVRNSQFLPVILREEDQQFVPEILQAFTCYRLYEPMGYQELLLRLARPMVI